VNVWLEADGRLRSSDMAQVGLLTLAVVGAALVIAWPARTGIAHEGWYAVAQTRSVVVALLALGYGTTLPWQKARQAWGTAVAVAVVALSALPLELLAHVASVPATPVWWAWTTTPAAVAGQLTIGAVVGKVARWLRLGSLTFVLVPAVIAGAVALDVRLGVTAFNPLTAALQVAPAYLAVHVVLGLLGAALLIAKGRRERSAT
jgi:hypothetical protein